VISIVACCHSVKLCALAARPLRWEQFENFPQNVDRKLISCAVYLDVKQPSIEASHTILLTKFDHFGATEKMVLNKYSRIYPMQLSMFNEKALKHPVNNCFPKPQGFTSYIFTVFYS